MSKNSSIASRAIEEGREELEKIGFRNSEVGFHGEIQVTSSLSLPATIKLPEDFPNALPEIYVERKSLGTQIPHQEKNGKVCIAPNTGVLIDSTKARSLVRESILRAQKVLQKGLTGENEGDFLEEFQAYWNAEDKIGSLCDAEGNTHEIVLVSAKRENKWMNVFADSRSAAEDWLSKTGYTIKSTQNALFIRLARAFLPPSFENEFTNRDISRIVDEGGSSELLRDFNNWLFRNHLPAFVVFSMPQREKSRILAGLRIERATGKAGEKALAGFRRPDLVPGSKEFHLSPNSRSSKIEIMRLDTSYLLPRGGASRVLLGKSVLLLGCGSIGSHLASNLAAMGVGTLRLVDSEDFEPANLHRHELGARDFGKNKAEAMSSKLSSDYPHLKFEPYPTRVQQLFKTEPDLFNEAHLIISALGDETLELQINDFLPQQTKRLHVWVEPLGIGGHLLLMGFNSPGCYRCLFEDAPNLGLHNVSAFAAPGQTFARSMSGCSGTFMPFSAIDAKKAANEAAMTAIQFLIGKTAENLLVSWRGHDDDFISEGFILSPRGKMFSPAEIRVERGFGRNDCRYCKSDEIRSSM